MSAFLTSFGHLLHSSLTSILCCLAMTWTWINSLCFLKTLGGKSGNIINFLQPRPGLLLSCIVAQCDYVWIFKKKNLPHDKVFKLYVNSNSCVNKITTLLLKRLLKTFLLGSCQRVCVHSQGKRGSTHCIFFWHAWPWISSRLSWQAVNSVNSCPCAP